MEKEKLSDRLKNLFMTDKFNEHYIINMMYFLLLVILNFFSKNLFLLVILTTVVYLSWLLSEITSDGGKYIKIISQSYLILSSYSFLYISNFRNSKIIYLWILVLISSVKILEHFLDEILVDENNKKFHLTKFGISGIMIIMLSIIHSIFMKQKILVSLLVNFFTYFLMFSTRLIPEKYQKDKFLMCYNIIAFPVIFICILLMSGILSIR